MIYLIVALEKQKLLHILSVCVCVCLCVCVCVCVCVALFIHHEKCICRITLPFVTSPALPNFSTLPHKRNDFRENVIKTKMCVFIFCTTSSQTFLILRRTERDIVINVYRSSCKVSVILVRFESTVKPLNRVSKNPQHQIS